MLFVQFFIRGFCIKPLFLALRGNNHYYVDDDEHMFSCHFPHNAGTIFILFFYGLYNLCFEMRMN